MTKQEANKPRFHLFLFLLLSFLTFPLSFLYSLPACSSTLLSSLVDSLTSNIIATPSNYIKHQSRQS